MQGVHSALNSCFGETKSRAPAKRKTRINVSDVAKYITEADLLREKPQGREHPLDIVFNTTPVNTEDMVRRLDEQRQDYYEDRLYTTFIRWNVSKWENWIIVYSNFEHLKTKTNECNELIPQSIMTNRIQILTNFLSESPGSWAFRLISSSLL